MISLINNIKTNRKNYAVFIVYCMVGLGSALVDVVGLKILSDFWNVPDIYAITIAYVVGMLSNYAMHNILTFKVRMSRSSLMRYLVVVGMNYVLSLFLIFLIQMLGVSLIASKIITLPVISISGYLFSKRWIYT